MSAVQESKTHYWNGKEILKDYALTQPKLILVEGMDELRFLRAFCRSQNLNDIGILDYNGKTNLSKIVTNLSIIPGYDQLKAIGITRDADDKLSNEVFKDICQLLEQAKFEAPTSFGEFTEALLKVGVFILPGKNEAGELEDLLFRTISANDDIKNCVIYYIDCVKTKNVKLKKPAKSNLYAWLSCQKSPALRLGEAADQGLFDFNHECLGGLGQFLRDLSEN